MVDQNHSASMDVTATEAELTAGSLLQRERERAGLTRETVAQRLNLLPAQVAALELSDFKGFPGETFVKGHLRSYARLLKLDCDTVLRAYRGAGSAGRVESPAPPEPTFAWRPVSLETKPSVWKRYSGLAAAFAVVLGLWAWQQQRDQAQVLSLTAATSDSLGGIDSVLNDGGENALMDSVQLLPPSGAPAANSAPAPAADAPAPADVAAAQPQEPAAVGDGDRLSLRFTADCWIEIKDRDNRLLVATLKHADEQLQIEGRGPFKVLLGYAPGVVMAYNGAPVKVDVSEGSRSTRLIVGSS